MTKPSRIDKILAIIDEGLAHQPEITDGYGNYWELCTLTDCDLHVVRPGKTKCRQATDGPCKADEPDRG